MAIRIVRDIVLDFSLSYKRSIRVKRYDNSTRFVNIRFTDNGRIIEIPSSVTCTIKMNTPDDRHIYNNATMNGDGSITVEFTEQMLWKSGLGHAEIIFSSYDDLPKQLSSMTFEVVIEDSVYDNDEIIASDEFNALTDAIVNAKRLEEEVKEAVEEAISTRDSIIETNEQMIAAETTRTENEIERVSTEATRKEAEAVRIQNETARITSETTRVENEAARVSAESKRADSETKRVQNEVVREKREDIRETNEGVRIANEIIRDENELARTNAEDARNDAETARSSAESDRIANEELRTEAESHREADEEKRKNSEILRNKSEETRTSAETTRQENELTRISNENARKNNELARQQSENTRTDAETDRLANEEGRVSAETARVINEASRVSSENARISNETDRVTNEKDRQNAEELRVTEFNTIKADAEDEIEKLSNNKVEAVEGTNVYKVKVTEKDGTVKTSPNLLNYITIGTVEAGDADENPSASISGEFGAQKLNLRLPVGKPFKIKKTYSSISVMNEHVAELEMYDFALIDTGDVDDEDNAKLFVKVSESSMSYLCDLSGSQGIQGERGLTGITPLLTVGTVETSPEGTEATATITGTAENPILNLVIPRGNTGKMENVFAGSIPYSSVDDTQDIKSVVDQKLGRTENAVSATKLEHPVAIGSAEFDGSKDITLDDIGLWNELENKGYTPGQSSSFHSDLFGLAWLCWTNDLKVGFDTNEEAATALSNHDIVVTQTLKLRSLAPDADELTEDSKKIWSLAKAFNRKIRRFEYIQIESERTDFRTENGENSYLNPDGTWDGSTADLAGCTRIYNRQQINEWFEYFASTGADGVFLDDWGYDETIEHICYQMGYSASSFSTRNDALNKKWSDIIDDAHSYGLDVITNGEFQPNVGNYYTHFTENDVVAWESCIVSSDRYLFNMGHISLYNYYTQYYSTGLCKAKIWSLDYLPDASPEFAEKVRTYNIAMAFACGAHYVSSGVRGYIDMPFFVEPLVKDPDRTIIKVSNTRVQLRSGNHSIEVIRGDATISPITEEAIDKCMCSFDGYKFKNAFIDAPITRQLIHEKENELNKRIDDALGDYERNAMTYWKTTIDDWYVPQNPLDSYTNYLNTYGNYYYSDNAAFSGNLNNFTISYPSDGWHGFVLFDVFISDSENNGLRGKEFEFGATVYEPNYTGEKYVVLKLATTSGDPQYIKIYSLGSSILSDNTSGLSYRFTVPGDCTEICVELWDSWFHSTSAGSLHCENCYLIDVQEHEIIAHKKWYTNLFNNDINNTSMMLNTLTASKFKGRNTFDATITSTDAWGWSSHEFSVEEVIAMRGKTFEFGCSSLTMSDGTVFGRNRSDGGYLAFGVGIDSKIGNMPNPVTYRLYGDTSNFSDLWNSNMYHVRFTVPEDATYVSVGCQGYQYTTGLTATATNVYFYCLDEENLAIRGKSPTQSALRVCLVDDDIETETPSTLPDTLYLTNKGRVWITNNNGEKYKLTLEELLLGESANNAYPGDKGKIAYDHSQTAHAPSDAQANVQSDWNATSGDAFIKNKPTALPASDVSAWAKAATKPSYTASEVGASPTGHKHTKSEITDFPTSMPASDVSSWAKAASKPTYTASEVGAAPASHSHSYLPLSGGTVTGATTFSSTVKVGSVTLVYDSTNKCLNFNF